MAKACIKRLHALEDDSLVSAIASQPTDVAKQICLYALMKQSRLVWEFMLTVIGEKDRLRDMSMWSIKGDKAMMIREMFADDINRKQKAW